MRRAALIPLVTLLAVVGFALGRTWPQPLGRSTSPSTPATSTERAPLPPCPEVAPIVREVAALSRERGRLDVEILEGRLYDADSIGMPIEWPEDLPTAWREPAIERQLEEQLGEEGEILALDCSEYPCIAIVAPLARVTDFETGHRHAAAVVEGLRSRGLSPAVRHAGFGAPGGGQLVTLALAFVAPEHEFPDRRKEFRFEELDRSVESVVSELLQGHVTD